MEEEDDEEEDVSLRAVYNDNLGKYIIYTTLRFHQD